MTPADYAYRHAALITIRDDDDPALTTPTEYAAATELERVASAEVFLAVAATAIDRLRASAAIAEWVAEGHAATAALYARTVCEVEAMLAGAPAP